MESIVYDTVVIGAGIIGCATAYHLAKQGQKALVLEQFPFPHNRGSSHGHSRILRKAYPAHQSHYTKLTSLSVNMWRDLERESGSCIFKQIGVLSVAFDPEVIESAKKSLRSRGLTFRSLDRSELKRDFDMLKLPPGSEAIFEADGGMLLADKALHAFLKLFLQYGGTIKDSEKVIEVQPGSTVTVKTTRGVYRAKSLVVAAGPWAGPMLTRLGLTLPLQPQRISAMYWREQKPNLFSSDRIPVLRFLNVIDGKHNLYSLPCEEYPGLFKLCLHDGEPADPESRDANDSRRDVQQVSSFISKYIAHLDTTPSIVDRCLYTMTPDVEVIMDRHPVWKNIIVGAGFSGHGFKLAPMVGKLLSQLTLGEDTIVDMTPYSFKRYPQAATTAASWSKL